MLSITTVKMRKMGHLFPKILIFFQNLPQKTDIGPYYHTEQAAASGCPRGHERTFSAVGSSENKCTPNPVGIPDFRPVL
jgi:hypothetical protein